jgi:hypothetical protein
MLLGKPAFVQSMARFGERMPDHGCAGATTGCNSKIANGITVNDRDLIILFITGCFPLTNGIQSFWKRKIRSCSDITPSAKSASSEAVVPTEPPFSHTPPGRSKSRSTIVLVILAQTWVPSFSADIRYSWIEIP